MINIKTIKYKGEQNSVDFLSEWLSNYGFEIFQNHTNDKYGCFLVKGTKKRPDLFIRDSHTPTWWNCAIEIKRADDGHGIKTGIKIIDYCTEYCKGNVQYFIKDTDEQLFPKYFLLGTEESINGKLFLDDPYIKPLDETGGRKNAIKFNQSPPKEYIRTFELIRHLWILWTDRTPPISVGILLSDKLNEGGTAPYIQYQKYRGRWYQSWNRLGSSI